MKIENINNIEESDNDSIVMLSSKETSDLLGCTLPTFYDLIRKYQDFPCIRVGKNYKVEKTALREWLKKRHS